MLSTGRVGRCRYCVGVLVLQTVPIIMPFASRAMVPSPPACLFTPPFCPQLTRLVPPCLPGLFTTPPFCSPS